MIKYAVGGGEVWRTLSRGFGIIVWDSIEGERSVCGI